MHPFTQPGRLVSAIVTATLLVSCGRARPEQARGSAAPLAGDTAHADHAAGHDHAAHHATHAAAGRDSAFEALQARGALPQAMGVDQDASAHRFDSLRDGGRIELQMRAQDAAGRPADSASVGQIRRHLQAVAAAFGAGDFSTPAFVHMRQVPGTDVMAARRAHIVYAYRELPLGAELRITTRDSASLRAVHAFLAFQRGDHRAGGRVER